MRKLLQITAVHWLAALLLLPLASQAEDSLEDKITEASSPVVLKVANRTIFVFRHTLLGETPELRAARAHSVINEVLDSSDSLNVRLDPVLKSYVVLLDNRRAFIVTPNDVNPAKLETVLELAEEAADNLRQVVAESQQSRDLRFLLIASAYSGAATLVFVLLIRLIYFLRNKAGQALPMLMQRKVKALKVGGKQVVEVHHLFPVVSRVLQVMRWLLVMLLVYEWLSFVLSQFPYTRPWGESLNSYLLEVATYLFRGIVNAIPGLIIALAIFFLARGFSGFTKGLLRRMAAPSRSERWLNMETLEPTQRLTAIAIWLFALAMAYPYLPGSGTDAFKGLSVLVGLMVSLGASSVIGQAASGLILTYTRTLRTGEYVRIGEHEGTVTDLGVFTTRIRTGLGEVLTIPNSMITGNVTKNYSRAVIGQGFVVDVVVTIGYDTPWRQVEAMLIEAANRTEGILSHPAPLVFQTALTDFYPEYRLVAQAIPSQPRPRAEMLSTLHAHIQDVFNEYGVQIMSPHYVADPLEAKLVPPAKMFSPPAKPKDQA
jgi:small-conductance mechanosensitive channel